MAIYTVISDEDLRALLERWDVPPLQAAFGLPAGSINTNVALEFTDGARAFLRHTTARDDAALAFEAEVLEVLASAGVPGPRLLRPSAGGLAVPWSDGRVSLFGWLEGVELAQRNLDAPHLRTLGRTLGRIHGALDGVRSRRDNPYGPEVVDGWLRQLRAEAHPGLEGVAEELLAALAEAAPALSGPLPTGVIHADLFIDNVKWPSADAPVPFDYEMACTAPRVLDVAIALNAWCFEGGLNGELARALVEGYEQVRPLTPGERAALHPAALFGAVRFTASRIRDFHLSVLPPDRLSPKDYRTWLARVRALRAAGQEGFRALWERRG